MVWKLFLFFLCEDKTKLNELRVPERLYKYLKHHRLDKYLKSTKNDKVKVIYQTLKELICYKQSIERKLETKLKMNLS